MTAIIPLLAAWLAGSWVLGEPPALDRGPFVGHVGPTTAFVWARAARSGRWVLAVSPAGDERWQPIAADADPGRDLCLLWQIEGLRPETVYRYRLLRDGDIALDGDRFRFVTAPADRTAAPPVRIAFGSCARENRSTARVWDRIGAVGADAVVLLGDTPYINSTKLSTQRRRYRAFASVDSMRRLLSHTPWYGVWDDHDFGRDNTDGNLAGKADARRAFIEYHANPSYGNGTDGVYTRFRRGPVEVFLLDTRYFAGTEPSPVDPERPTLLGGAQWDWLADAITTSDALFKVVASGIVWNGAVRRGKRDHWETYAHERDALFELIGEYGISGVVLVAGDIHRSRVVRHASRGLAGYDLVELITSPMHGSIHRSADVPHPGLIKDMGEPNSFLLLTVDSTMGPTMLEATFIRADGTVLYHLRLSASDLSPSTSRSGPE